MCHIILNADRKPLFCLIVKHRVNLSRRRIFGGQTVSAGKDGNILKITAAQRAEHIQIQRFSDTARLLGAVQHRNLFHGFRDRLQQMFPVERAVKTYLDKAAPASAVVLRIHHFFDCLADTSHGYDHMFCFRVAVILKQLVRGACFFADFAKQCLHNPR